MDTATLPALLALGEVLDGANVRAPALTRHPPHTERHRKRRAIFTSALDLAFGAENMSVPGALVPGEILIVTLAIRRRHQQVHVAADDLVGRIAKHRCSRDA